MRRFSLRRRLPLTSTLFLVLAVACGVVAFWVVRGAVAAAGRGTGGTAARVMVLVAIHDLTPADVVGADDVAATPVAAAAVPPGALTAADQAVGTAPTAAIASGEILTATRVGRGGPLARILPVGSVAFQVELTGVPSGLGEGDHVDVLATAAGGRTYTSTVASDVRVLALPDTSPSSSVPTGPAGEAWVVLLVSPEDATALATAAGYARLSLAILPSGAFTGAPPTPG
ncbi:MAG: Flp pilus assembly protein CpaB [Actinomycetota bacterium]